MSSVALVERLRAHAEEYHEMCGDCHEPMLEAADVIEKLEAVVTKEVAKLEAQAASTWGLDADEIERLDAMKDALSLVEGVGRDG